MLTRRGRTLPRITDEAVLREMVISAFRQPKIEVVVTRNEKYPDNLCKQLALKGVDRGIVCRVVNKLVGEGMLVAIPARSWVFGSQPDPIPLRATRYEPTSSLTQV